MLLCGVSLWEVVKVYIDQSAGSGQGCSEMSKTGWVARHRPFTLFHFSVLSWTVCYWGSHELCLNLIFLWMKTNQKTVALDISLIKKVFEWHSFSSLMLGSDLYFAPRKCPALTWEVEVGHSEQSPPDYSLQIQPMKAQPNSSPTKSFSLSGGAWASKVLCKDFKE